MESNQAETSDQSVIYFESEAFIRLSQLDRSSIYTLLIKALEDFESRFTCFHQSIKDRNIKELAFIIHSIKGLSLVLNCSPLAEFSIKLENAIEKQDLKTLQDSAHEYFECYLKTRKSIQGFIDAP